MRFSTLEIRWHDTKPIFSCDFQPFECVQHKRQLNPYQRTADNVSDGDGRLWRVATAGGDNNVRIWLAIPNPPLLPSGGAIAGAGSKDSSSKAAQSSTHGGAASSSVAFAKPKVEYLATLDRHTLTVNVVRFSPSGHLLATAGDDSGTGGILLWRLSANPATATFGSRSAEDAAYEKEAWQAIKMIKSKSPEIYDMAWSPDGQYLLTGGTDGAARIHRVSDGSCVVEMLDHKDWVQGVAWDPLNKFVATQGKDRQMLVYSLQETADGGVKVKLISKNARLVTEKAPPPTAAVADPASLPIPAQNGSLEDSKPVPPVPVTSSQVMYSDEESTPFFRRLAFSTDGALLVTPAGQYEDPSSSSSSLKKVKKPISTKGTEAETSVVIDSSSPGVEKKHPSISNGGAGSTNDGRLKKKKNSGPSPTSYFFARGQLANETPIAHLSGHRTSSIVVKFNPVLWNLRSKKSAHVQGNGKGKEKAVEQDDVNEADNGRAMDVDDPENAMPVDKTEGIKETVGKPERTGMFDLKSRTIYALATHDTILLYDTQQEAPICMFSSLHFAAFTDLAWTADGLTLIATSSDGYASIFTFEEGELGVPAAEQPKRHLGPLEESLVNGASTQSPAKPSATPSASSPVQPVVTINGSSLSSSKADAFGASARPTSLQKEDSDVIMLTSEPEGMAEAEHQQKKVKKRVALTHVGPLGSSTSA